MRKLIKYSLETISVLSYFKDRVDGGNKLSKILLENIDLSKGYFYTLLTKEADLSRLYKFDQGGILPAYPVEEVYIDNLGCYKAEKINSIDNEIALLIKEKMQQFEKLSCIFDDVSSTYHKDYRDLLFLDCGMFYKKEVYYFLIKETMSTDIIKECLRASNSFWHFLCILRLLPDMFRRR